MTSRGGGGAHEDDIGAGWLSTTIKGKPQNLGAEQKRFHGATQNLYIVTVSRFKSKQEKNDHCFLFEDLSRQSARPDHHNVFIIVPRVAAIISLTRVTVTDIGTTGHGRFPSWPCPATAVIRADF